MYNHHVPEREHSRLPRSLPVTSLKEKRVLVPLVPNSLLPVICCTKQPAPKQVASSSHHVNSPSVCGLTRLSPFWFPLGSCGSRHLVGLLDQKFQDSLSHLAFGAGCWLGLSSPLSNEVDWLPSVTWQWSKSVKVRNDRIS